MGLTSCNMLHICHTSMPMSVWIPSLFGLRVALVFIHLSLCVAKLLYSVSCTGSRKCLHPVTSLHNNVVFLSYKPSETCQILLWITKRSCKIFIVKFQMSTCDAGDGIFKSYLTNISTEHSLNKTTKGLLHSITRSGKWSLEVLSCIIVVLFMPQHIP